MRKLGRIVRRLLTAVSLLLFVAVLAAWVRGYWSWETAEVDRQAMDQHAWRWKIAQAEWSSGEIGVLYSSFYANAEAAQQAAQSPGVHWDAFLHSEARLLSLTIRKRWSRIEEGRKVWNIASVVIAWQEERTFVPTQGLDHLGAYRVSLSIAFPCWMAAMVFGALPSWRCFVWWRGVRRRRLVSLAGRCPVCGYDLRASPQRCPECGTAVEGRETPGGGAV